MKFRLSKTIIFVILFAVLPACSVYASADTTAKISWSFLVFGLLGGLALFLYGMEKMSEGMRKSAGNHMRSILAALTKNRVIGLCVGIFVTMVIQSSSATSVMLVSVWRKSARACSRRMRR